MPQRQGKGGKEAGQVLQSAAPGPVRGRAINDRAGERSGTVAVFRNLPEKESRDKEGEVAVGLRAPTVSRGAPGRAEPWPW